jgi:hypothetical protein
MSEHFLTFVCPSILVAKAFSCSNVYNHSHNRVDQAVSRPESAPTTDNGAVLPVHHLFAQKIYRRAHNPSVSLAAKMQEKDC